MRAELLALDHAYRRLKHAYEDQARLMGRTRRPARAELDRVLDAIRAANDEFDAARRAVEAAARAGVPEEE
ncbi:MAG TPA: hypothetical protein VFW96_28935 [Thermomicrobiales bacterium]|nr:hypothetical protein [Thermomicrobiales bacterium]